MSAGFMEAVVASLRAEAPKCQPQNCNQLLQPVAEPTNSDKDFICHFNGRLMKVAEPWATINYTKGGLADYVVIL